MCVVDDRFASSSASLDVGEKRPTLRGPPRWPDDETTTTTTTTKHDGSVPSPWSAVRRSLRRARNALLYSYMNRVLDKGASLHRRRRGAKQRRSSESDGPALDENEELGRDDLYACPESMASRRLCAALEESLSSRRTTSRRRGRRSETPTRAFARALWDVGGGAFAPGAFWQLVQVTTQVVQPLLVRTFLRSLEAHDGVAFAREGLPVALGLFVVSAVDGVAAERQKYHSFRAGIVCRAAVVSAAYRHVLALSPEGREGLTTGEVTNLVAVDAQKLFELTQELNFIWSCPLTMVVVTVLLLLEMGPCALVGMASMFLLVPSVRRIVSVMMAVRKKRVAQADARVESTTSMLQGMRFTKINHYESRYLARVAAARSKEMRLLRKELAVFALSMLIVVVSPVLAAALSFAAYVVMDDDNELTASRTFTVLFLFAVLRFPVNYVGKLMGKAAQGLQACERLANFFARKTQEEEVERKKDDQQDIAERPRNDVVLEIRNGRFTVGGAGRVGDTTTADLGCKPVSNSSGRSETSSRGGRVAFTVSDVTLSLRRSEVLCVVGTVGSGKSVLCQGLVGEVSSAADAVVVSSGRRVAYAGQTPFILNATIRENILFGAPYDKERYDRVIDACCLGPDLDRVGDGTSRDLTEIGERGVTLSGGQKQRVSIARCVYARPDVAVLDDPLSALDASTARRVFDELFRTRGRRSSSAAPRLLDDAAVVLVTHADHFLHRVDRVMLLANGRPGFLGTWDELSSRDLASEKDAAVRAALTSIRAAVREDDDDEERVHEKERRDDAVARPEKEEDDEKGGALITVEEREFGLSDWRTWLKWFQYAGGATFVSVAVLVLFLDRFFYVITEWWLAAWTEAASPNEEGIRRFGRDFPPQSEGRSAQYEYLVVYGIILALSCVATFLRCQWLVQAGASCSNKLFRLMTERIVRAPMSYFDTTPLGRILNRFTYDVETLDVTLTQNMMILMTSLGWFFAGITLQMIILPYQAIAVAFVTIVYWSLLLHYRKSAVDLQRLDAVSRSPVQARLSEVVDGATTIRAFGRSARFHDSFSRASDDNTSAMMNFMVAFRWLSVRIQLVGSVSVLFCSVVVVLANGTLRIPPGLAGMLVIWSNNFTVSLGFMVQGISESEAALTSVERASAVTRVPQERPVETDPRVVNLPPRWPDRGDLTFEDVGLRYREGLPRALDGLSFSLRSGQRCGVVGRTGAGKSSVVAALLRLTEIETGRITLDGVDLAAVGLGDVRGRRRGVRVVPQDPVLFPGTMRECLDPFGESDDDEMLRALRVVGVADETTDAAVLEERVEEGGRDRSAGERQLLCLARAVLSEPRVLVLDEATASVDGETDAFVQTMLRNEFRGTTLLTIAHRLHTIMDYDVVLVMDAGRAVEFGPPEDLLRKDGGHFRSLVDSTGKQSANALRDMMV